jgi:hypothetical protein
MTRMAKGKGQKQKAGLNKSILSVGFATLNQMLTYKMEQKGGPPKPSNHPSAVLWGRGRDRNLAIKRMEKPHPPMQWGSSSFLELGTDCPKG